MIEPSPVRLGGGHLVSENQLLSATRIFKRIQLTGYG